MLFLPALLAADVPAQVVNSTSLAHQFAPAEGVPFEKPKGPKKQHGFRALLSMTVIDTTER